jgi:hypothetical protein
MRRREASRDASKNSEQSSLCKAHRTVPTDHDVIEDAHINEFKRLTE